jgi:hypothetical protein
VLANEIAFVKHVARGFRQLGGQVDVAGIALARLPLVFVRVASEALRHRRTCRLGVTRHALPADRRHVLSVREAEVLARERSLLPRARLAVARFAGPRVVRFGMATRARCGAREMQRPFIARMGDAFMARHAGDAGVHMRAMLEWMARVVRLDPEHTSAGGERQDEDEQQRPHRASNA